MGFFSDFIGSFTGSNERRAARKAAEGFNDSINYTKEQIEQSRNETKDLMGAAFANIQAGANAGVDANQQALAAQLRLLGAGKEELSPEGASNALNRGAANASNILMGNPNYQKPAPLPFTPVGTNPINVKVPEFNRSLLGGN